MASRAQIIVTLGPACVDSKILLDMVNHQADMVRLNFSWGNDTEKKGHIQNLRSVEKNLGKKIPIIADLSGPRVQIGTSHGCDEKAVSALTDRDLESIKFCIDQNVDFIAVSFVGSKDDILKCRETIDKFGGKQKIIAKIERQMAVENLDEIIEASDAIMVARGDLGNDFPLEKIPFIQAKIIDKCNKAKKMVIVATEMLLSMTENPRPTRAEVTDVAHAILMGADAVMLSEETARGKYPVEAVSMMERIVVEAEKHE